ncbi:MAG TPA: GGDEF domain-containing protein [Dehalococcoidia bacterium]
MFQAAPDLQDQTIADHAFRRGILVLRWLLLITWVCSIQVRLLDVSTTAFIVSTLIITSYDIFHTIIEFRDVDLRDHPRLLLVTRLMDVITITVAMIALHDERNPVWAVYFITIVGNAHILERRQMMTFVSWTCANYLAFAVITSVLGHEVSWAYVAVVSVLIYFMGFNASILAGGEQRLRDVIAAAATTDSLTGLPNRRRFHSDYARYLAQAVEEGIPLAVMLVDVDHFKEINDRDGHPAGDDKLREVAAGFAGAMRADDVVARYGGDEFVVVAPRTNRENAMGLAERLCNAATGCAMSVSIGVAVFPEDADDSDGLIAAADAALYRAKQAGRDCIRGALAAA